MLFGVESQPNAGGLKVGITRNSIRCPPLRRRRKRPHGTTPRTNGLTSLYQIIGRKCRMQMEKLTMWSKWRVEKLIYSTRRSTI